MKHVIIDKIEAARRALLGRGAWPADSLWPEIEVMYPTHRTQGDYSTNVAMKLAKILQRSPLDIGHEIAAALPMEGVDKVEVAPPGFINIFVNEKFLAGGVRLILEQGEHFGENKTGIQAFGAPQRVLVEFLSANPTGPIHLGNGRAAFTGDVLVRVLRACQYEVIAEYIINDYGKQLDTLAESVLRRYLQAQGINIDYPDELYRGDYIKDLASQLQLKDTKLGSANAMVAMRTEVKEWALAKMVQEIKQFVEERLHIHYDVWKSERSLYEPAKVEQAKRWLRDHGLIYEAEGATFFNSTKYGDDKDRVIIKANGETTYFFSDILYLIDKFQDRHIDHWIWYLGADHHGYEGRVQAALAALGHKGKLDVIFVQLVRLIFNGQELRMSKRQGTYITLEELIDEIGLDVARWFFLMYDANTHMDFDLNLARERSEHNPVFYVQYAYARICSLLNKVGEQAVAPIHVTNPKEEDLIKTLFQFPELVVEISRSYEVHRLPQYALELARAFHKFYTISRVLEMDATVNVSRLQLVQATQIVLRNTLQFMGITAPTKM